ncbi:MAG: 6-carboxytetrahydropterin synthase [Chloroflexi bacterium]|nr:6-carboxytetrahydropterin synthase [Chloroflexota bacterium]
MPEHEGACKAFHGHRYAAEITCAAPSLDSLGRIIDFGVVKSIVGGWIYRTWDHTAILMASDPDPAVQHIVASNERHGRPVYLMAAPPTAENIAAELATVSRQLLQGTGIAVVMVRVWETPNCSATWFAEEGPRPPL